MTRVVACSHSPQKVGPSQGDLLMVVVSRNFSAPSSDLADGADGKHGAIYENKAANQTVTGESLHRNKQPRDFVRAEITYARADGRHGTTFGARQAIVADSQAIVRDSPGRRRVRPRTFRRRGPRVVPRPVGGVVVFKEANALKKLGPVLGIVAGIALTLLG